MLALLPIPIVPDGLGYNVQTIQLVLTIVAVAVDLLVVFRIVWLGLIRQIPRRDWPYLGQGLAEYARAAREAELKKRESQARLRKQYGR